MWVGGGEWTVPTIWGQLHKDLYCPSDFAVVLSAANIGFALKSSNSQRSILKCFLKKKRKNKYRLKELTNLKEALINYGSCL